jgi:hypothetical protein
MTRKTAASGRPVGRKNLLRILAPTPNDNHILQRLASDATVCRTWTRKWVKEGPNQRFLCKKKRIIRHLLTTTYCYFVSVSAAQKEPSEIGHLVEIPSFQLVTKRPSWRNEAANASHGMPEINYQSASYWKYSNRDIIDRDTARKI